MAGGNEDRWDWRSPPQFGSGFGAAAGRVPGGGGAPGGFPGAPGPLPGASSPFVRTVPQPLVVRPPMGLDFHGSGQLTGATNATTPAVIPGVTYTVPLGSTGYLRSFTLQVLQLLPTSSIFWSVRIDGNPVPGLSLILTLPGNIAVWSQSWGPDEIFVEIPPGKTVDIQVGVTDAGAYTVAALFHGWSVPTEIANAAAAGWSA